MPDDEDRVLQTEFGPIKIVTSPDVPKGRMYLLNPKYMIPPFDEENF